MPPLTENVARPTRDGAVATVPVAANTRIFQGALVELDSAGRATPATKGANKVYLGVALEPADNRASAPSGGAAGAINVTVRCQGTVHLKTTGTAPVRGRPAYVEDDETVGSVASSATSLGRVIGTDDDGVWVRLPH